MVGPETLRHASHLPHIHEPPPVSIRDWPAQERPREKLLAHGPARLTDAELLAVLFGTGLPGVSAVDLGGRLLREFGCLPYPMPYVRTPELVGFQRWVVRRADLRMSWGEYSRARFRPERVVRGSGHPLFEILA